MNVYTEKEKEALIKFRSILDDLNLNDERNSDVYLIKWLRARDLNLNKAEHMLRESIKWRENNKIDEILSWEAPKIFSQIFPAELCGHDKNGCPIIVSPLRYIDMNEFWKCDKHDFIRYSIQTMEKFLQLMRERSTLENPVTQVVVVHDMDGFNIRSIMNRRYYEFAQESSKQILDNYPDCIHKAYILFAPRLFSVPFAIMKHILPKRTIEKFQIHGFNKDSWIGSMLQHIDLDQIPSKFGGTNYEFDKTAFAQCVLPGSNKLIENDDDDVEDFSFVKVPAGKKHQIDYIVESYNSKLSWVFKTEDYDISFGLVYESVEEIIPNCRVESAKSKQVGQIICEKIGKYSLIFDNTYSRLRSKSVHFNVDVEVHEILDLQIEDENNDNNKLLGVNV